MKKPTIKKEKLTMKKKIEIIYTKEIKTNLSSK